MRLALSILVKAAWSTIPPRAVLIRYAVGFMRARRSAFIRCRVEGINGQLIARMSGLGNHGVKIADLDADICGNRRIGIRIGRNGTRSKRRSKPEHLCTDIAKPYRAQRFAHKSRTLMIDSTGPAFWALPSNLGLVDKAARERENECQYRHCHPAFVPRRGDDQKQRQWWEQDLDINLVTSRPRSESDHREPASR